MLKKLLEHAKLEQIMSTHAGFQFVGNAVAYCPV